MSPLRRGGPPCPPAQESAVASDEHVRGGCQTLCVGEGCHALPRYKIAYHAVNALAGWMPRVFAEVAGNHLSFTLTAGLTFGSRTTRSTFHPATRRYVCRWMIAPKSTDVNESSA